MKKVQIKGKLSLDKMTIAKLDDQQTNEVIGGGKFLSIGSNCTVNDKCCYQTEGFFCSEG